MACGACCLKECKILQAHAAALANGEAATKQSGAGFVRVSCTNPKCTSLQMHAECFDKLETRFFKDVNKVLSSRGHDLLHWPHEIWLDKGLERTDKKANNYHWYQLVKPKCECVCGKGFFCASYAADGEVRRVGAESAPSAAEQKRAKIEAAEAARKVREKEERDAARESRRRAQEAGTADKKARASKSAAAPTPTRGRWSRCGWTATR